MILRTILFIACMALSGHAVFAQTSHRVALFANQEVNAWRTIIYPASKQALPMHRHDKDRVLVALTDGLLKITNDKGASHYLQLERHKAYYLPRDRPGELHNDENMSRYAIKVIVVELNKS